MKQEYQNFKDWQGWIWLFIKWMIWLFFRPFKDFWNLFYEEIILNLLKKKWSEFWKAIFPISLIILFIIYSFNSLWNDTKKIIFHDRYEKVIIENYKTDIENFFKKYEERFLAHDCWFMQEVWTDEAMYDKWKKISYDKNYKCEAFYNIQEIKMLPLKIWEIEKAWDKLKVKWELIRIEKTNWQPIKIAPIRFELWKTIDMDLWHFNLYWKPEDRWIESEFKKL